MSLSGRLVALKLLSRCRGQEHSFANLQKWIGHNVLVSVFFQALLRGTVRWIIGLHETSILQQMGGVYTRHRRNLLFNLALPLADSLNMLCSDSWIACCSVLTFLLSSL